MFATQRAEAPLPKRGGRKRLRRRRLRDLVPLAVMEPDDVALSVGLVAVWSIGLPLYIC